jgi:hypothetical protein
MTITNENDEAYANAAFINNSEDIVADWIKKAEHFRIKRLESGTAEIDISYGASNRQKFDIFQPNTKPLGTVIFVHGGYWIDLDKSYWSHFASGILANGYRCIIPSYDLCPTVKISDITGQIKSLMCYVLEKYDGMISLVGHSAGGHLVSRMVSTDQWNSSKLRPDLLKRLHHVVAISPIADLRPLLKTSMNNKFCLNRKTAEKESPVFHTKMSIPLTVLVGERERPAFLSQAESLSAAWSCLKIIAKGKHHFSILDDLENERSELVNLLTKICG